MIYHRFVHMISQCHGLSYILSSFASPTACCHGRLIDFTMSTHDDEWHNKHGLVLCYATVSWGLSKMEHRLCHHPSYSDWNWNKTPIFILHCAISVEFQSRAGQPCGMVRVASLEKCNFSNLEAMRVCIVFPVQSCCVKWGKCENV